MIAHSYFRFSHGDQSKGASIARQRDDTSALISRKGWVVGDEYIDDGRSASKGRHRAEGAELYRFEEEARDGLHAGAVLVVERLDRLSRLGHDDTYTLIKSLGDCGVHIATVDGDAFYEAGKKLDMIQVMTILIKAEAAREEVEKKGQRVSDSHARKYEEAAAKGTALGKVCPYWLAIDQKTNKYVEVKERADLVRRIYAMADAGDGAGAIARKLNSEKVPVWNRWPIKRPVRAWDRTRIRKILTDEAVIGWRKSKVGRDSIRIFPTIVDAEVFERIRQAAPIKAATRGGARSPECANLVAGLARCGVCHSSMMYDRKHAWGKRYVTKAGNTSILPNHAAQLICRSAHNGGCENRTGIGYRTFEKALLDAALHIALDDRAFVQSADLAKASRDLAEATQNHRRTNDRAAKLWEAWADNPDSTNLRQLAEKAEGEVKEIQGEIDRLTKAKDEAAGRVSKVEHFGRIANTRKLMDGPDFEARALHRKKAMEGLRSVITDLWCIDGVATIAFAGGMAAMQIQKGKVIAQASAAMMFANGDYGALTKGCSSVPEHIARDVYNRITKLRAFN